VEKGERSNENGDGIGKGGTVKQAYNGFGGFDHMSWQVAGQMDGSNGIGSPFLRAALSLKRFQLRVRGRLPNEEDYPICGCLTRPPLLSLRTKFLSFCDVLVEPRVYL